LKERNAPLLKALNLPVDQLGKSTEFRWRPSSGIVAALADLVRAIQRYYPIAGRDTQSNGVARKNGADPRRRDLFETNARIAVQKWIAGKATAARIIQDIHRRFSDRSPDGLLSSKRSTSEARCRTSASSTVRELELATSFIAHRILQVGKKSKGTLSSVA
jgi:hypothetical protein